MGRRRRVEDLERKANGAPGRRFVLWQDLDNQELWRVEPGGEVLTFADFEQKYEPTEQDDVLYVVYTKDWRNDKE